MSDLQKLFVLAGPLLLLILTAIAGYAYSRILFLSLPIPKALALFTVVLPLITGISTQGAYGLIQRPSKKENYRLMIPLITIIGFQLIYETIVATLALTYIVPPSTLKCGLNERWGYLSGQKNVNAVRAIQDTFNCCGLNTIYDRAYPFSSNNRSTCAEVFNRNKSCFGDWRKAEQTNAGLLLLVALVVFIIKAISILSVLTSPSGAHSKWAYPFRRHTNGGVEDPEADNRAVVRRLIEQGAGDEEYHDEAAHEDSARAIEAPPGNDQDRGPRVEPASLIDAGNEWRDEGEGRVS